MTNPNSPEAVARRDALPLDVVALLFTLAGVIAGDNLDDYPIIKSGSISKLAEYGIHIPDEQDVPTGEIEELLTEMQVRGMIRGEDGR